MKSNTDDMGGLKVQRSMAAIPRRLRLAYPELAALFPLLVVGHLLHEPWGAMFDTYLQSLSLAGIDRLALELEDVLHMGLTDEFFAGFCQALGLTSEVAPTDQTICQFVAAIKERVSVERLARFA